MGSNTQTQSGPGGPVTWSCQGMVLRWVFLPRTIPQSALIISMAQVDPKRSKKKRKRGNPFVDDEAEVANSEKEEAEEKEEEPEEELEIEEDVHISLSLF